METLDIIIELAFVAYALASGFWNKAKASRNLEEYFLAGRTLPGSKAGLSMAATQFAADTPLLVTGIIAVSGIFGLWQLWIYALAFLLMGFVLAGSWRPGLLRTSFAAHYFHFTCCGLWTRANRYLQGLRSPCTL